MLLLLFRRASNGLARPVTCNTRPTRAASLGLSYMQHAEPDKSLPLPRSHWHLGQKPEGPGPRPNQPFPQIPGHHDYVAAFARRTPTGSPRPTNRGADGQVDRSTGFPSRFHYRWPWIHEQGVAIWHGSVLAVTSGGWMTVNDPCSTTMASTALKRTCGGATGSESSACHMSGVERVLK